MVRMLKVEAVEVEDRSYTVRFLELRTLRGQKRYSAEIVLDTDDHIILDDDSLLSLEARARRLAPATIYSRMLARATAA